MNMMQNPYQAYQPVYGNPYGMRVQQPYYQQPVQASVMEQHPAVVTMVGDRREVDSQIVSDLAPHFYANIPGGEVYVKQLDTTTGKSIVTVYRLDSTGEQPAETYVTKADLRALEERVEKLAEMVNAEYAPRRRRVETDDE